MHHGQVGDGPAVGEAVGKGELGLERDVNRLAVEVPVLGLGQRQVAHLHDVLDSNATRTVVKNALAQHLIAA